MTYLPNKKGFLGIDNQFKVKERAVIVPFGLEKTVTYGSGTKNGPKEIIEASHQVELFDDELNCDPYKKIGINRLSIGVQSFDNNDLKFMNRSHNVREAITSIKLAQKVGFENITIDLNYGLPNQTL